jgi:P pilus assembly chaperone PapD
VKLLTALALFLVPVAVLSGRQGGITLTPTKIVLDRASGMGAVSIRNDSSRAVAFQVRSFAWSNTADASMRLEPTDDVVVSPTTVSLSPGETRRVRIGARVAAVSRERAYRLILDEVAEGATTPGMGLATRMQFSLPAFLPAPTMSAQVSMPAPELAGGSLRLSVINSGAIHVTPQKVEVRALDASGAEVWSRSFKPWYLLAGESRTYHGTVTAAECRAAVRLVAVAEFAEGARLSLKEDARVTVASCASQ